jgi:hypothetical protein
MAKLGAFTRCSVLCSGLAFCYLTSWSVICVTLGGNRNCGMVVLQINLHVPGNTKKIGAL